MVAIMIFDLHRSEEEADGEEQRQDDDSPEAHGTLAGLVFCARPRGEDPIVC